MRCSWNVKFGWFNNPRMLNCKINHRTLSTNSKWKGPLSQFVAIAANSLNNTSYICIGKTLFFPAEINQKQVKIFNESRSIAVTNVNVRWSRYSNKVEVGRNDRSFFVGFKSSNGFALKFDFDWFACAHWIFTMILFGTILYL